MKVFFKHKDSQYRYGEVYRTTRSEFDRIRQEYPQLRGAPCYYVLADDGAIVTWPQSLPIFELEIDQ